MVEYLSFHNSSFALRYFLVKMARPQCETPLVRKCIQVIFKCRVKAKAIMPCVGPYIWEYPLSFVRKQVQLIFLVCFVRTWCQKFIFFCFFCFVRKWVSIISLFFFPSFLSLVICFFIHPHEGYEVNFKTLNRRFYRITNTLLWFTSSIRTPPSISNSLNHLETIFKWLPS